MEKRTLLPPGFLRIMPASLTFLILLIILFGLVLTADSKGFWFTSQPEDCPGQSLLSIDLEDFTEVFEGDRIPCKSQGLTEMRWRLSDSQTLGGLHSTFIRDDPVLINVEQFRGDVVMLTVYGKAGTETVSCSKRIILHKIYWGDPHLHANVGDKHARDYLNNILRSAGKYQDQGKWWALDWLVSQSHAFRSFLKKGHPHGGFKGRRDDLNYFNNPGQLTVLMGGEYSQASKVGHVMHLTAIYSGDCTDFTHKDYLCSSMAYPHPNPANCASQLLDRCWWIVNNTESDIILFPHHSTVSWYYNKWEDFETFWTHWDAVGRDRFIRGLELVNKHGSNMDFFTNGLTAVKEGYGGATNDHKKYIEYAIHLWSNKSGGEGSNRILGFNAGTDWHQIILDETSIGKKEGTVGRTGVWARFNNRSGIFEGLQSGKTLAADFQNININLRIDGQHAFGNWIELSGPADVEVIAWPRMGSDTRITDLYLVHYDASNGSWESSVIDHQDYAAQPNAPQVIHYSTSVVAGEGDAFWVTTRAWNHRDDGILSNGDGALGVPLNPYRTWSSPVWIDRVMSD